TKKEVKHNSGYAILRLGDGDEQPMGTKEAKKHHYGKGKTKILRNILMRGVVSLLFILVYCTAPIIISIDARISFCNLYFKVYYNLEYKEAHHIICLLYNHMIHKLDFELFILAKKRYEWIIGYNGEHSHTLRQNGWHLSDVKEVKVENYTFVFLTEVICFNLFINLMNFDLTVHYMICVSGRMLFKFERPYMFRRYEIDLLVKMLQDECVKVQHGFLLNQIIMNTISIFHIEIRMMATVAFTLCIEVKRSCLHLTMFLPCLSHAVAVNFMYTCFLAILFLL
ncbi:hypothetical protein ACJX0J_010474, partial [Zea mays]